MFYNQQNLEITQNLKFYEAMYDRDHHKKPLLFLFYPF